MADLADRLRKLTQEAVATCLCGLPTCESCRRQGEAETTLRYALPALADLVGAVEGHVCRIGGVCLGCRALTALRGALEVE